MRLGSAFPAIDAAQAALGAGNTGRPRTAAGRLIGSSWGAQRPVQAARRSTADGHGGRGPLGSEWRRTRRTWHAA